MKKQTADRKENEMLAIYTERAHTMTTAQLEWAIRDIAESMEISGAGKIDPSATHDQYVKKLWAEFDCYSVELQRRRNAK